MTDTNTNTEIDAPLSVAPEIERLRALLREIGSDNEDERELAGTEAIGTVRLVGALVRCIALEQSLRAADAGRDDSLAAILGRIVPPHEEGEHDATL